MKIRYYPIDNPMTTAPDDCRMQVAGYESVGEKEIFEYMTRPGSGVTPAEARGNYEEFIGAHEYFLRQGYGINTEFIKVRPTLQGTLRDQNDSFDHARHKVNFKVTLGKRYNKVSGEVKVEKAEPSNNAPAPVTFEDICSATVNEMLTPNSTASLTGMRLLFRQDDPGQGIFLIDTAGNSTRVEKVISQKSTQAVFLVPEGLASSDYTLEVQALPPGNKKVKAGTLPDKLTV